MLVTVYRLLLPLWLILPGLLIGAVSAPQAYWDALGFEGYSLEVSSLNTWTVEEVGHSSGNSLVSRDDGIGQRSISMYVHRRGYIKLAVCLLDGEVDLEVTRGVLKEDASLSLKESGVWRTFLFYTGSDSSLFSLNLVKAGTVAFEIEELTPVSYILGYMNGGMVNCTPFSPEENETFTVTAIADEGWRFSHWILDPSFGERTYTQNPLTLVLYDSDDNVTPVFLKDFELGEKTFSTWGRILWSAVDGNLQYPAGASEVSWMEEGPGTVILEIPEEMPDLDWEVFLNDSLIDDRTISPGQSLEIPIDAGQNALRIVGEGTDTGQLAYTFTPGLLISSVETLNGLVDITPARDRYVQGELISVNATPDDGFSFINWSGGLPMDNSSWAGPATNHMEIGATFLPTDLAEAFNIRTSGDRPWQWNTADLTPNENPSIEAKFTGPGQTASLAFSVEGPGRLSFWIERDYPVYSVVWINGVRDQSYQYPGEKVLMLDTGTTEIEWVFTSSTEEQDIDAKGRIGDLDFTPGYMIVLEPPDLIEATPQKEFYAAGETVTLTMQPEEGTEFQYWSETDIDDDYSFPSYMGTENPLTIQASRHTRFIATPSQYLDYGGDTYYTGGYPPGRVEFRFGRPVSIVLYNYNYPTDRNLETTWLERPIVGPGIFHFNGGSIELYLISNGVKQEMPTVVGENDIVIPPGEHVLRWETRTLESLRTELRQIYYDAGYRLTVNDWWSGQVETTGEDALFEPGESVTLTASNDSTPFLFWRGDVSSEAPVLELTMDQHLEVVAYFGEPISVSGIQAYTGGDFPWVSNEAGGGVHCEFGIIDRTAILHIPLVGPGILTPDFQEHLIAGDTDDLFFYLDGQVLDYAITDENDVEGIQLPPGEHVLTVKVEKQDSNGVTIGYTLDSLVYEAGFQFAVASTGGSVLPATGIFPGGEVLDVETVPLEGNQFKQWVGDFAGEAGSFPYEMNEHIDTEAVFEFDPVSLPGNATTNEHSIVRWRNDIEDYPGRFLQLISQRAYYENPVGTAAPMLEFQLEGPGGLEIGFVSEYWEFSMPTWTGKPLQVWLDEALVHSFLGKTRDSVTVSVPAGQHMVKLLGPVRQADETYLSGGYLLDTVEWTNGYNLDFPQDPHNGNISGSAAGIYGPDTMIEILATPDSGYTFGGWMGLPDESRIQENPLELTMDQHFDLEPLFVVDCDGFQISSTMDIAIQNDPSESDEPFFDLVPGPEAFASLIKKVDVGGFAGVGILEFLWKQIGAGEVRIEQADVRMLEGDTGIWNRVFVYVDASTNPKIVFEAASPQSHLFVQPVALHNGILLDTETSGSGTVSTDPDSGFYPLGESVEVLAVPDEGWEFASWSGDFVSQENPLSISFAESGEYTLLAVFQQVFRMGDLDLRLVGGAGGTMDGGTLEFGDGVLEFPELEGPGFLSIRGNYLASSMNGSPFDWFASLRYLQLDEGSYSLQLQRSIESGSARLYEIDWTPGVTLTNELPEFVALEPLKSVYSVGETVHVSVKLPLGKTLFDWKGSFSGFPASFDFQITEHTVIEPDVREMIHVGNCMFLSEEETDYSNPFPGHSIDELPLKLPAICYTAPADGTVYLYDAFLGTHIIVNGDSYEVWRAPQVWRGAELLDPVVYKDGAVWTIPLVQGERLELRDFQLQDAHFEEAVNPAFITWLADLFTIDELTSASIRSPWQDLDQDGLTAYLEYGLGSHPGETDSDAGLHLEFLENGLSLQYPVNPTAEGVQLELQASINLLDWIAIPSADMDERALSDTQNLRTYFYEDNVTENLFFRVHLLESGSDD